MKPRPLDLPDRRIWLRVAEPEWADPLDDRWAQRLGGRWNPPDSHRTLYVNADIQTARLQVEAMLRGQPVEPEDLDDEAYAAPGWPGFRLHHVPERSRSGKSLGP